MPIDTSWYNLESLSKRWAIPEGQILALASDGAPRLSVYFEGKLHRGAIDLHEEKQKKQNPVKYLKNNIDTAEGLAEGEKKIAELAAIVARHNSRREELKKSGKSDDEILLYFDSVKKKNSLFDILPGDAIRFVGRDPVTIKTLSRRGADGCVVLYTPEDKATGDYPKFALGDIIVTQSEVDLLNALSKPSQTPMADSGQQTDQDFAKVQTAPQQGTIADNDEYVEGNSEIVIESGLCFNTFRKYLDLFNESQKTKGLAEIKIEKTQESRPKNKIKKSDIRRVLRFNEQY